MPVGEQRQEDPSIHWPVSLTAFETLVSISDTLSRNKVEAEEMVQQLRALTALTEDPGAVSSTYVVAHKHL